MKSRPILFSGQMVRALLEERKTQARRVVKPQPAGKWDTPIRSACTYGQPGDLLWVHEAPEIKCFGKVSPIFMRRIDSRLTLRITDVRVEHVQNISEKDAQAEGCDDDIDPYWVPSYYDPDSGGHPSFVNSFHFLWDSINAELGYEWITNPWVWVVSFEVIQNNVDQILKGEA